MSAEAIVTVSAACVAAVQLAKWAGLRPERGPLAVLISALIGVSLWAVSDLREWDRALIWPLFSGWVAVATSAAGVFGFTRAVPDAVSSFTHPPGQGAGSGAVERPPETVATVSTPEASEEIPMGVRERTEILRSIKAIGAEEAARVLGMLRERHERYAEMTGRRGRASEGEAPPRDAGR
jgi:hypothetical protein